MTDVLLKQTLDGGDVELVGGILATTDGFETAAYLSLFGGNEDDSGRTDDDPAQWWGNFTDPNATEHQRSETQHVLRSQPITSALIRALQIAAERDLAWMVDTGYARSVSATATIPERNRVRLVVEATTDAGVRRAEFLTASSNS